MYFVCSKCREAVSSIELCDEVETLNRFCYLRGRQNSTGGCEAEVTARVRIG